MNNLNVYRVFRGEGFSTFVLANSSENAMQTFRDEYQLTPSGRNILMPDDLQIELVEEITEAIANATMIIAGSNVFVNSGYKLKI